MSKGGRMGWIWYLAILVTVFFWGMSFLWTRTCPSLPSFSPGWCSRLSR